MGEREKQRNLDEEVREMISTLTSRLGSIHKSGSSSTHTHQDEEEQGMRMITLAGTNLGATMRGDVDDKGLAPEQQEDSAASYVVNSNFQAINNSVMLGGTYHTNDPGVHLDITDYEKIKSRKTRRGTGAHHHAKRSDNLSDETDTDKN